MGVLTVRSWWSAAALQPPAGAPGWSTPPWLRAGGIHRLRENLRCSTATVLGPPGGERAGPTPFPLQQRCPDLRAPHRPSMITFTPTVFSVAPDTQVVLSPLLCKGSTSLTIRSTSPLLAWAQAHTPRPLPSPTVPSPCHGCARSAPNSSNPVGERLFPAA